MSKELKTPVNSEAEEKDKKEQATFFSLRSLTSDEIACLTSRVSDKFGIEHRLYNRVFPEKSVDYYDLVVLISILEERFHYLSSLPVSEYPFLIPDFTRCESALNKLKNILADEPKELNSSESEPEEKDREEENHIEEVHPKTYLTPVYVGVLKKALENHKHLCSIELRDSEVCTDKSLYSQELEEFRLTVDLLSDLANVRNVIFERTEFIEVSDELPF